MRKGWLGLAALICLLLSGCNITQFEIDPSEDLTEALPPGEEVALTISTPGWLSEQEYKDWFASPLAKHNPNIQLDRVIHNEDLQSPSGSIADLFLLYTWQLSEWDESPTRYDLDALIKRLDFDLENIESAALDMIRASNVSGELIAMPIASDFGALYYNEEIFDAFQVHYPEEQMTWPELIELTELVSGEANGNTYGGFGFAGLSVDMMFASLPYVDPATERATVHNEQWSKLFQYVKELYFIPSNGQMMLGAENYFINQKNLAMMLAPNLLKELPSDFRWDLAPMPILEEAPDTGRAPFGLTLAVSSQSEQKELAMQFIKAVLSEEVQMQAARNGRPGVLKTAAWRQVFGDNLPQLEGKQIEPVISSTSAKALKVTKYDQMAQQIMEQAIVTYAEQDLDIEDTLRKAEEQINQYIDSVKETE